MGGLTLWCRKHLLPQWKVLAVPGASMFAVIVNSYYTKGQAERRADRLNDQVVRIPAPGFEVTFMVQKNTCF